MSGATYVRSFQVVLRAASNLEPFGPYKQLTISPPTGDTFPHFVAANAGILQPFLAGNITPYRTLSSALHLPSPQEEHLYEYVFAVHSLPEAEIQEVSEFITRNMSDVSLELAGQMVTMAVQFMVNLYQAYRQSAREILVPRGGRIPADIRAFKQSTLS